MPPAFVQTKTGTTNAVSPTSNVTAGNMLVGVVVAGTTSTPSWVVTSALGNTLTQVVATTAYDCAVAVYVGSITTGGAETITATASGISAIGLSVSEYSGIATTSPVDGFNFASGTFNLANPQSTGSVIATGADLIFTTLVYFGAPTAMLSATGYTVRSFGTLTPAPENSGSTADQVVTPGTYSASWAGTPAGSSFSAIIVALKPTSSVSITKSATFLFA